MSNYIYKIELNDNQEILIFDKNQKGYFSKKSFRKIAFLDRSNKIIPQLHKEYICEVIKEFDKYRFVRIIKEYKNDFVKIQDSYIRYSIDNKKYNIYLNTTLQDRNNKSIEKFVNYFGFKLYKKALIQLYKNNKNKIIEIIMLDKVKKEFDNSFLEERGYKGLYFYSKILEQTDKYITFKIYFKNSKYSSHNEKIKKEMYDLERNYINVLKTFVVKEKDIKNKYYDINEFVRFVNGRTYKFTEKNIHGFNCRVGRMFIILDDRKIKDIEINKNINNNIVKRIIERTYTYENLISEKTRYGTSYDVIYEQANIAIVEKLCSIDKKKNEHKFKLEGFHVEVTVLI